MKRRLTVFSALFVSALALLIAPAARSQVIVYALEFKHESGFNLDFFEGGYFVAPALGGSGTFILTSHDNGRKILNSSAGTGNFFHGVDKKGKRFSVVSAGGGDGSTSLASYVGFGEVTGTVELVTSDATFKLKVARKMNGSSIAAGDETSATGSSSFPSDTSTINDTTTIDDTTTDTTTTDTSTTTTDTGTTTDTTTDGSSSTGTTSSSDDGTVGFVNISSLELSFDGGYTKKFNKDDLSVEGASTALVTELKQKGYVESTSTSTTNTTGSSNTSTGTGTSTGSTTTTTTSVPEIAVSQEGTEVFDGSTVDMGTVTVGSPVSFTFTISNTGSADLTGVSVSLDGVNASEFSVTANPTTVVSALTGTTTFTVQFTPATAESKTAAVHISSNDSDESTFDINIIGTGN